MLTRRQARLLGLTTGNETSSTVSRSADASMHQVSSTDSAVTDAMNSSAECRVETAVAAVASSSSRNGAVVLRFSAESNGNSSNNDSSTQLPSMAFSSSSLSSYGGSNTYGRRGRLGVREAEAMLTSAQNAIDYWSAAGTTAGSVIQFASTYDLHKADNSFLLSLPPEVTQRSYEQTSMLTESGRVDEKNGQSSTTQRPARLSATQLRARWRGVMRNCTTLQVNSRNNATAAATMTTILSTSCSSPSSSAPSSLVWGTGSTDWHKRTATLTPNTQHMLQLSHSAGTSNRLPSSKNANDNNQNSHTGLGNGEFNAAQAFLHAHSAHRDMTASLEASPRPSTTYFIPPFHSDAPFSSKFPSLKGGASTSGLPSLHTKTQRRPLTALALRQQTQAQLLTIQRRLSHEVHYQVYVKAHKARMQMLFGLNVPEDNDQIWNTNKKEKGGASEINEEDDAVVAGEAGYLKSLDANKSEEEAKILQVIASIDKALKRQLAAVYEYDLEDKNVPGGMVDNEGISQRNHTVLLPRLGTTSTFPSSSSARKRAASLPTSSPSFSSTFLSGLPAIIEAVIGSATESVEAFVNQLLPYQREGVRWLLRLNAIEHMNGILADDMGLGKTAQTVVYLSCYKDMIEEEVQRPLEMLRARHTQLCQHALGLAAPVAEGEQLAEADLPPWLLWSVAATSEGREAELKGAGEEQDSRQRGAPSSTPSAVKANGEASFSSTSPAHAPLTAAHACCRTIQLLKEVKRWLWQLDETSLKKEQEAAATAMVLHGSSQLVSPSSPFSPQKPPHSFDAVERQHHSDQQLVPASPAADAASVLSLKRRRGRPPKQLSAMMAAAAVGQTPPLSSSHSSLTSQYTLTSSLNLSSTMDQQCRLTTCSPGLNRQLDSAYMHFRPVLIIAPLSTLPHWASEFQRFSRRGAGTGAEGGGAALAHVLPLQTSVQDRLQSSRDRFTVYVLNGLRPEREERMHAFIDHIRALEEQVSHTFIATTTPVLVIPHDMLTKPLSGPLRQIARVQWHVVVIDEAQRIKSANSILFKKVRLLHTISRLVLTGTPLQNNTKELFSLLQFLAPQSLTSSSSDLFEQLDSALIAASRSNALEDRELHILLCRRVHRLLMPFILRREKTIIKTALPPLRDYAVLCPLLPFQEAQVKEVKRKQQEGTLSGNPHIQYRKILLHPYTTQAFFYVNEEVVQTSGKLLVLDFMMRFLQRTRHKFLIFCGWTLVLDVVETLCGMRGIPFVRLDGKTSVEKREANIEGFNRPISAVKEERTEEVVEGGNRDAHTRRTSRRNLSWESSVDTTAASNGRTSDDEDDKNSSPAPCCFLISKVAGGVGLNLQAADTVFLLDVDYNPQRDAQALSRVYRVGQTREVRVFRLVIDHPIERNIVAIHEAKENLGRAVVQAGRYDLHSSVQEREAALQQIFRSDTLSRLSGQWSMPSPTSAAMTAAKAAATVGGNDLSEAVQEEDAELADGIGAARSTLDSCSAASSLKPEYIEDVDERRQPGRNNDSLSSSPAQTPTDLHRVFLSVEGPPLPSALKKPKTENTNNDNENDDQSYQKELRNVRFTSFEHARPPPQHPPLLLRKRRRISFKLEKDAEERSSKDRSLSEGSSGGDASTSDGAPHGDKNSTLFRADSSFTASKRNAKQKEEEVGGHRDTSEDAQLLTVVTPAEHLLAMRKRLEEVLLRHDGERGVLQDMFRSLEASLTTAK